MASGLSTFLQTDANMLLCQHLGRRLTAPWVRCLGRLYYLQHRREKAVIDQSVGTVLANVFSSNGLARVRRRVFEGIYRHYTEKLFNALSASETLRRFFDSEIAPGGLAAVEKARSKGRGVLLVTGHYGGVEYMPGFLGHHGFPVSIVAHFSTPRLRRESLRQAAAFRTRIIEPGRMDGIPRTIAENLQENRVVITQCDEIDAWRPDCECCIRFLGRLTPLDRTIHTLARRMRAPLVFALMHRDRRNRYRFIARRVKLPPGPSAPGSERLRAWVGAALLGMLERFIYRHPDGWYQWAKFPGIPSVSEPDIHPLPIRLPEPVFAG